MPAPVHTWLPLSLLSLASLVLAGCAAPRPAARQSPRAADAWTSATPRPRPAAVAGAKGPSTWPLAVQAYSFRRFTLIETADRLAALGVHAIELYPGQTIGGDLPGKTHHSLDVPARQGLQEALRQRGIRAIAYGVVKGRDEADWTAIFEFAKAMEIGIVCCEPGPAELDLVAALCDRYDIRAAIHNHAKPSAYWQPEAVLAAVSPRTARLGACVDNGHWTRSGLAGPAGIATLGNRIHNVHLKDVDSPSLAGECVPLGRGFAEVTGVLAALWAQGYDGPLTLEYESQPDDPGPGIAACIAFLERCADASLDDLADGRILAPGLTWTVAETWKALPRQDDGRWSEKQEAPSPGMIDTTDDGLGKIEASGLGFPKEHYPNAFDNTPAKWCLKERTAWIQYAYPEGRRESIAAYSITTANDAPDRDPKDWRLLGSNDGGATWTLVDAQKGITWPGRHHRRVFTVKAPAPFAAHRFEFDANHGADTFQLSEIELLVPAPRDAILTPAQAEALIRLADAGDGFEPLFAEDLGNALLKAETWAWVDGVLTAKGGGDIWTKERYGNVVLDLEFRCEASTNSGIFLRCSSMDDWLNTAIEVQILQPDARNKRHVCGAIFDCEAPWTNAVKAPGEWNRCTILALDNRIVVRLNGLMVLDMDLNRWTEPGRNPDGTANKFKYAYRDMARVGHLGLQYHGQPIQFRNLRLKTL